MIVYAIHFPNEKAYVGITTRPLKERMMQHLYNAFHYNKHTKLANALKKYVDDGDTVQYGILQTCSSLEELKSSEKYWINKYNSYNTGYNLTLGGDGVFGHKRTEEQMQRAKEIAKKISTPERNKKISETLKNKVYTREYREKNSIKSKITFEVISPEGKSLGIWKNMRLASEDLNLSMGSVWKALHGKKTNTKGYLFKVLTEDKIHAIV